MGQECPVCGSEEADGEHLANHLAFTALVRGGDHETWLDEHVPDWADRDPESLAPEVTPHATETETEPSSDPHGHETPDFEQPTGQRDLSGEAASILEEAQELTEQMAASEDSTADSANNEDSADSDTDADSSPDSESE
jgi:hypothetical protein